MNMLMSDEMLDIPAEFRSVAKQHGRAMLMTVMDAGLASEAVKTVVGVAKLTGRSELLSAVGVLAKAFNNTSTLLCKSRGWTEEMLAECDRDLMLAYAGKVKVAGSSIILDS